MLSKAIIQPHIDYACFAWYSNLTKKNEKQNPDFSERMHAFLPTAREDDTYISQRIWNSELITHDWKIQSCINLIIFKYVNDQCPNYLKEVFEIAPKKNIQTRGSFQKLECSFGKANAGQMALSYIGPTLWRKTPEMLKQTKNSTRLNII